MQSRRLIGLGSLGLAAAVMAVSNQAVAEPAVRTIRLGRGREEDIETLRKVSIRKNSTPKKGKPTKAEKKAVKRARTRGEPQHTNGGSHG